MESNSFRRNQIWFFVGVYNGVYPTSIIDTYTKPDLVPRKGIWFPADLGLVLIQLTNWNDAWAVQKISWGWHWSTFKNIGCKCLSELCYTLDSWKFQQSLTTQVSFFRMTVTWNSFETKVIIDKFRGEMSLLEQDTIENVS